MSELLPSYINPGNTSAGLVISKTIHVSNDGNDLTAALTPYNASTPFETLHAAVIAAEPNDTIVVLPGIYEAGANTTNLCKGNVNWYFHPATAILCNPYVPGSNRSFIFDQSDMEGPCNIYGYGQFVRSGGSVIGSSIFNITASSTILEFDSINYSKNVNNNIYVAPLFINTRDVYVLGRKIVSVDDSNQPAVVMTNSSGVVNIPKILGRVIINRDMLRINDPEFDTILFNSHKISSLNAAYADLTLNCSLVEETLRITDNTKCQLNGACTHVIIDGGFLRGGIIKGAVIIPNGYLKSSYVGTPETQAVVDVSGSASVILDVTGMDNSDVLFQHNGGNLTVIREADTNGIVEIETNGGTLELRGIFRAGGEIPFLTVGSSGVAKLNNCKIVQNFNPFSTYSPILLQGGRIISDGALIRPANINLRPIRCTSNASVFKVNSAGFNTSYTATDLTSAVGYYYKLAVVNVVPTTLSFSSVAYSVNDVGTYNTRQAIAQQLVTLVNQDGINVHAAFYDDSNLAPEQSIGIIIRSTVLNNIENFVSMNNSSVVYFNTEQHESISGFFLGTVVLDAFIE